MIGNVAAGISSLKADYYALSAALALLLTDLISIPLTGLISEAPLKMALGLLLGWAVVLCLPWFSGEGIESLEEVGFAGKDIIRKAWIGPIVAIPAFMASTIIFVFTGRFFDSLPSREHPLQTMLTNSPGPLVWACAVFSAVLAAPFVEEVIFRGLLFPALAKRLGSTVGAAILSSLFFASLHSTGPATWPSLAVFGMVSCYLTVKTGSLVPSMAMHGTYNLMMLLMASAF